MPPDVTILPFTGVSDGNSRNWPERGLRNENPQIYLTKLASKYAKDTNLAGSKFTLSQLPNGYALFGKTRAKEPTHVDRYLYGHDRYAYRSVEEFYPHFFRLMSRSSFDDCPCRACKKGNYTPRQSGPKTQAPKQPKPAEGSQIAQQKVPNRPASGASAPAIITKPGQQPFLRAFPTINGAKASSPLTEGPLPPLPPNVGSPSGSLFDGSKNDEEGAEDVYRTLVLKLRRDGSVDEPIIEQTSFDWRINRGHVKQLLHDVKVKPHFLPRLGEIVLFVRDLPSHYGIGLDADTKMYRSFDIQAKVPTWPIRWEAGLITQLPQESVDASDLVAEPRKEHQVSYSGYRIEPISEVSSDDKPWSKRHTYIPLHQLRPFVFYRELLKGLKPLDYHPTIANTLEIMCSLSLIERYHFKGTWPSAAVFSKGVFLGSELIMVGDTIRLLPTGDKNAMTITDAMRVTSIKTKLIHLDALDNPDYDSVNPLIDTKHSADRTFDVCIHFAGMAYTQDPSRAWGKRKSPMSPNAGELPSRLAEYGDWYPLHDPAKRWEVPFGQVAGKCFEAEAAEKWLAAVNTSQIPTASFAAINKATASQDGSGTEQIDISLGIRGLCKARAYAKSHDKRIELQGGRNWFWADTRIEQLDLREVNGIPVTDYLYGAPTRDARAWKRALFQREKGAGFAPRMTTEKQDEYAQAVGRGRSRLKESNNSMLAASAIGGEAIVEDEDEDEDESEDDEVDEIPARNPLQTMSANDDLVEEGDEDEDEDMGSPNEDDDARSEAEQEQHELTPADSSDIEDLQEFMRKFTKGKATNEVGNMMDLDG